MMMICIGRAQLFNRLDLRGQFIPLTRLYRSKPVSFGSKIMNFNYTTGEVIRTYIYPEDLWYAKLQLNDIKINNTLGTAGYAFITEDSQYGSITTLNLDTGKFIRHLYNTTYTRPDERFTSMYNGEPIRNWNGTTPSFMTSGTNGIALTSGNVYWGVKSSHRWYILPQNALIDDLSDEELADQVQIPGTIPSEQAGFTADDRGRLYFMASEVSSDFHIFLQQPPFRLTKVYTTAQCDFVCRHIAV